MTETERERTQARRIQELLARVQELEDRNEQLEGLLSAPVAAPMLEILTPTEGIVVGLLMKRELVTRDQLMVAIYSAHPESKVADEKVCDVFVCKIRKKLSDFGVTILTRRGMGWVLPPESKEIMRSLSEVAA
ncbi:MAG: helix-turn-helix domain-containing protein [Pigmentiphaga sp.]